MVSSRFRAPASPPYRACSSTCSDSGPTPSRLGGGAGRGRGLRRSPPPPRRADPVAAGGRLGQDQDTAAFGLRQRTGHRDEGSLIGGGGPADLAGAGRRDLI